MSNKLTLTSALSATVLVLMLTSKAPPQKAPVAPSSEWATSAHATAVRAPDEYRLDVRQETLADYIEARMREWPPATSLDAVPYRPVARDIAEASLVLGSADPDQDAVLLAGLAYFEGARFAAYVDDGRCNDPAWRRSPEGRAAMHVGGDCDGGRAYTLWQIHPIPETASSLWPLCAKENITLGRVEAAKCAAAIARRSMDGYGNLAGYTGEPPEGLHTKADLRLAFAQRAIQTHPFLGAGVE